MSRGYSLSNCSAGAGGPRQVTQLQMMVSPQLLGAHGARVLGARSGLNCCSASVVRTSSLGHAQDEVLVVGLVLLPLAHELRARQR